MALLKAGLPLVLCFLVLPMTGCAIGREVQTVDCWLLEPRRLAAAVEEGQCVDAFARYAMDVAPAATRPNGSMADRGADIAGADESGGSDGTGDDAGSGGSNSDTGVGGDIGGNAGDGSGGGSVKEKAKDVKRDAQKRARDAAKDAIGKARRSARGTGGG